LNDIIVRTDNLWKIYRTGPIDVPALQGISIKIKRGEFIAIAGPSGSGKTTLLNIIGGLDRPDKGEVFIEDMNLNKMGKSELAELRLYKIGFVFQAYNLIPVLSAEENVEFILLLQGVPREERRKRAREILDEVGLKGLYNRKPAELSGGQQQRVAVARAIVSNPSIVLADEPTANLDSRTGQSLLELMKRMNEIRGVTFIFSTHDKMVMDYARRLVIIRDGMIVEDKVH